MIFPFLAVMSQVSLDWDLTVPSCYSIKKLFCKRIFSFVSRLVHLYSGWLVGRYVRLSFRESVHRSIPQIRVWAAISTELFELCDKSLMDELNSILKYYSTTK